MRPLHAAGIVVVVACGGGDGDGTEVDARADGTVDECQPSTGWTAAPPVPLGPTQETATVAVDGKVYVLGGFNGSLGVIPSVQVYDTASCTWSMGPDLPRAVHHANAAVVNGTIYVVGAMETIQFRAVGHTWSWKPATETGWSTLSSMPTGTERGSAFVGVIGERIYVAGGLRGGAVAEVSAFDTATMQWDATPMPLPAARDHGCGGVAGGKLYVTGGRNGTTTTIAGNVYEYTPGGAWVERMAMLTARGGTSCGVIGDRIIVAGGEGNPNNASGVFAEVEAYTPTTNSWEALTPMATPRHGMGAAVWDGRLYVPGGATQEGFGAVDTHEVFTP